MEDKSLLLKVLGDTTELRIIDFLIDNLRTSVYKNEIINRTGLSRNSFFRVWNKLENYGIVKPVKNVGRAVLYELNEENKFVEWLLKVDWALIERSIEEGKIPQKIKENSR
jgi:DNA-binding transcriptional ArsR family regulator